MDVIIALQSFASPTLDAIVLVITNIGGKQAYIALLVLAFIGVDAKIGRRLASYFLAGAYGMELLKDLFATPRPFEIDPIVARSKAAIDTAPGASFPSGHALLVTAFWGLAASYMRRGWFTALAVVLIVMVSLSRLYLGVHFPSDVIGGVLLGLVVVAGGRALDRLGWHLRPVLVVMAGVLIPLALHLLLPTDSSGLYLGALAAFLVGPELVRHRTDGPWRGRIVLSVIGLALVFAAMAASSALIPDDVRHSALGSFVRYFLIGCVGTMLVPALGRLVGLTPRGGAPVAGT